jgi:3-oxoacyl-[acyl-carrier protein] reductase
MGRVALVTGGSRGIGAAVARRLAREGADVALTYVSAAEKAHAVVRDIQALGRRAFAIAADSASPEATRRAVDVTVAELGRLDILVNNAGYTMDAPAHKLSDDAWARMLDIHVTVPFKVCRAAAPHMREPAKAERDEGREVFRKIVNTSSTSGVFGNAGQANYAAGKAGVQGLTRTLAKEWGQFKINVNCVAYGYVETRLTASKESSNTMEIDGRTVQLGIPDQIRSMASMLIPLGRSAHTREAAGPVFFLCSPWSNYVHGQTLMITGGSFGGMGS